MTCCAPTPQPPYSGIMTDKTPIKTAKPSGRNGNVLPVGNHPGNTGGKKGRSGRKPDEWRARLRELTSAEEVEGQVKLVLADADHPHWASTYKYATEQANGRAAQAITFPQLTPEVLAQMPLAELQRLRAQAGGK